MVDIHCHILPGLDDGPASLEEAVCMGEAAIADGVTHVVCTPHANSAFSFDYALVRRGLEALRARLGGRLILATGCDFHLTPENLADLKRDAARFCINQRDYLLVEFNEFSIPPVVDQALHEIQLAGLRPIVTHPERNGILRSRPQRLRDWVRQGCYAQVTAGALTGGFGPATQRHAESWIEQGLIHFIASDAHNTQERPLRLRPAYDLAVKRFGADKARALFQENPLAAFEGKPLPHVPEVVEKPPRRSKRFFFF
jgi:protein-tyrosine phosphatase